MATHRHTSFYKVKCSIVLQNLYTLVLEAYVVVRVEIVQAQHNVPTGQQRRRQTESNEACRPYYITFRPAR